MRDQALSPAGACSPLVPSALLEGLGATEGTFRFTKASAKSARAAEPRPLGSTSCNRIVCFFSFSQGAK
jgi:hypothetical protein